jgi:hypothetical protein
MLRSLIKGKGSVYLSPSRILEAVGTGDVVIETA